MNDWPELMGKAEFGRKVLGVKSPSTVSNLIAQGRLVTTGKEQRAKVKVAESLALIANTRGARDDVAARHAAERGAAIPEAHPTPEIAPPASSDLAVTLRERRAEAELRRTLALASQEEMAAAKMRRELIELEVSDAAMKSVGATVRSLLDVLPDQLAPLVAPVTDLGEVHAIIVDQCRNVLEQLGQAMHAQKDHLARGAKA